MNTESKIQMKQIFIIYYVYNITIIYSYLYIFFFICTKFNTFFDFDYNSVLTRWRSIHHAIIQSKTWMLPVYPSIDFCQKLIGSWACNTKEMCLLQQCEFEATPDRHLVRAEWACIVWLLIMNLRLYRTKSQPRSKNDPFTQRISLLVSLT